MKLTFVLPGFPSKPTGGFKIIYSYADFLAGNGYDVTIIHMYMMPAEKRFKVKFGKITLLFTLLKIIIRKVQLKISNKSLWDTSWYSFKNKVNFKFEWFPKERIIPNADAIFATAYETADFINNLSKSKGEKFYFIQHFETWSASESEIIRTWKLPMNNIVIASWLQQISNSFEIESCLIPNFIDTSNFFQIKRIESKQRDSVVMLYHFLTIKGSKDGIEALKHIKIENPQINIILFGTVERPYNMPNDFTYFQNPDKDFLRDEIYNRAVIYLMPSYKEGWGLTATEAMACGATLVSTDNGGVNDFAINNKTAIITPVSDVKAMISGIQLLLDNPEMRISMAYMGMKKIQQFSIEKSGRKLMRLLELKTLYEK